MTGGHLGEEALVYHYYGDDEDAAETTRHLDACRACRTELERLKASLKVIEDWPVPERDAGYGERVWRRLAAAAASRAAQRRRPPVRAVLAGVAAASFAGMLAGAFLLGRATHPRTQVEVAIAPAVPGMAGERVLAAALSEHLAQSERILLEILNRAEDPTVGSTASPPRDPAVDLGDEQERASGLLADNRLYRQTATRQGQLALANVLEDLERVLLDVARGPRDLSPEQMAVLRARVDEQELVFKVRILEARLRDLGNRPAGGGGSSKG
jgi:hypothetical protein